MTLGGVARRLRLTIVGFGSLGRACAHELHDASDLEFAGVVRRAESAGKLPEPFAHVAVAMHLRDLGRVDAALLCVPRSAASGVARETIQLGVAPPGVHRYARSAGD